MILNKRLRQVMDISSIINISAIIQQDNYDKGWIFNCYYCNQKTLNSIVCNCQHEIYVCKQCIKLKQKQNKYYRMLNQLSKYCREIINMKNN